MAEIFSPVDDLIAEASTIDALVARERYGAVLGCEPACSTDDGTYGRAGFCTPLVEEALAAAAALCALRALLRRREA